MITEKTAPSTAIRRARSVTCDGCGGKAKQLVERDAKRLRQGFLEEAPVHRVAFECTTCEAVIYEDEFVMGRFLPPRRRYLVEEAPMIVPFGP
jgi:hypothetical protein